MSVSLMAYAWRMPCDNLSTKLILLKLADHANDDGVCWPSWGHLTKHTGCSRATVARSLNELEQMGIITRESRLGTSNVYNLHEEVMKKRTPPDMRSHQGKGYQDKTPIDQDHGDTTTSQGETPTRTAMRPPPCHGETQTIIEPSDKPPKKEEATGKVTPIKINFRKDENVSDDVRVRLASLYAEWIKYSSKQDTPEEKVRFKDHIVPLLVEYNDPCIASGLRRYCRSVSEEKYRSLRVFFQKRKEFCWPKRKHWTQGIDRHSSTSPDEQIAELIKSQGEYEQ